MAHLTPPELALLLDLVSKVSLPIGATINQLQPILQRATALASLKGDARIGAIVDPPEPAAVPAGTSGNGLLDSGTPGAP